jgi:Rhodopirellula transposase DDE domain
VKKNKAQNKIQERFQRLTQTLNERARRLFVATEALAYGYGGIALVSRATGMAPRTIGVGIREVRELELNPPAVTSQRIRRPGAGRKKTVDKDPTLKRDLEGLVEPVTRGDPESALRWTCKSIRRLADELVRMGHATSARMIAKLLREMGYSLQANRKTLEGASHPDRNAQFEHIDKKVQEQIAAHNPVISIDTKKKELVGDFRNGGKELRPKGAPEVVRVHDFILPELGRANPYGVYDIANNEAWVSVGIDHDTATFAVETIRRWWGAMGCEAFPKAKELLITADGGGSNGSRVRLWKVELQRFANELGIPISVCHLPPGTSKWNKIEHRLFSFITQNWRGKPLITHQVIISLIAATTTKGGLKVRCELDENIYPTGRKITDAEFNAINIKRDSFHGEWNYTVFPEDSS